VLNNLVTGGAGFIGTHLVRLLADRGEGVRVVDLREPVEPVPDVEYLQGSIQDRELLERAAADCDRVYHLAAHAGLWTLNKHDFVDINVTGTRNALAAARAAGAQRFVHTSTESVLLKARRGEPQVVDERTEIPFDELAGPYCTGKALAERAVFDAGRDDGLDIVVCNPTVPMGPGDPWLTPPTRMLLGFLRRRFPAWLPTTLNVVDARDVAEGLWLAAERGRSGARYILGGRDLELGELLHRLEAISGVAMPSIRIPYPMALAVAHVGEWVADHVTRRPPAAPVTGVRLAGVNARFDNRATRAALDWHPRPLDESLTESLADYRRRGLLAETGAA
jgi:dihydroflavonol-4-reductase